MPRMNIGSPMPIEIVSPSRREQAGGEVERLVDDDVVGGAHEVGLHFLGHRDDAVAHDLGDHRIGLACARCAAARSASLSRASSPWRLPASCDRDHEIAVGVDLELVARQQHRGRGMLLDQRRPIDPVAGQQARRAA